MSRPSALRSTSKPKRPGSGSSTTSTARSSGDGRRLFWNLAVRTARSTEGSISVQEELFNEDDDDDDIPLDETGEKEYFDDVDWEHGRKGSVQSQNKQAGGEEEAPAPKDQHCRRSKRGSIAKIAAAFTGRFSKGPERVAAFSRVSRRLSSLKRPSDVDYSYLNGEDEDVPELVRELSSYGSKGRVVSGRSNRGSEPCAVFGTLAETSRPNKRGSLIGKRGSLIGKRGSLIGKRGSLFSKRSAETASTSPTVLSHISQQGNHHDEDPVANESQEPYTPDTLPQYSVGDKGREEDMIVLPCGATTNMVGKLRVNDAAFVRRKAGIWTYAIVTERTYGYDEAIRFRVNARGSSKTVPSSQWGTCVRRVRKPGVPPDGAREDATPSTLDSGNALGQADEVGERETDGEIDGREIRRALGSNLVVGRRARRKWTQEGKDRDENQVTGNLERPGPSKFSGSNDGDHAFDGQETSQQDTAVEKDQRARIEARRSARRSRKEGRAGQGGGVRDEASDEEAANEDIHDTEPQRQEQRPRSTFDKETTGYDLVFGGQWGLQMTEEERDLLEDIEASRALKKGASAGGPTDLGRVCGGTQASDKGTANKDIDDIGLSLDDSGRIETYNEERVDLKVRKSFGRAMLNNESKKCPLEYLVNDAKKADIGQSLDDSGRIETYNDEIVDPKVRKSFGRAMLNNESRKCTLESLVNDATNQASDQSGSERLMSSMPPIRKEEAKRESQVGGRRGVANGLSASMPPQPTCKDSPRSRRRRMRLEGSISRADELGSTPQKRSLRSSRQRMRLEGSINLESSMLMAFNSVAKCKGRGGSSAGRQGSSSEEKEQAVSRISSIMNR